MEEDYEVLDVDLDDKSIDRWIKQLKNLKKEKWHEHLHGLNKCQIVVNYKKK
jgi:hypothetical protein